MLTELHTNPTQLTGLLAFALAAASCLRTAMRARGARLRLWRGLALVQAACVAEVLIGLRHRLHDGVDAVLQAQGWYPSRSSLQIGLIVVALLLGLVCMAAAARARHIDRHALVAALGSVLALWLFVVETISLHQLDALMYTPVGPVMAIACLWAAAALVVAGSAWRSASLSAPPPAAR